MIERLRATGMLLLALWIAPTHAGSTCAAHDASPAAVAAAAATALQVRAALEQRDAPLALLARAGTDLARQGLVYSHVGIVLRDHPDGRWSVVHLLNHCGTKSSSLYVEGLVNFFADDLVAQHARLVWLSPRLEQALLQRLSDGSGFDLHQPVYNLIARPDSRDTQNSTAWVIEMLAAGRLAGDGISRELAQLELQRSGHRPDVIEIPYRRRVLGGLFSANVDFTDHPLSARLSGRYPVVTVRSILRWLEQIEAIAAQREWRDGQEQSAPGPA